MHAMEAKLREETAGLREQLQATETKLRKEILVAKGRLRGQIDRVELPSGSKSKRSRPISSSGRSPSGRVTWRGSLASCLSCSSFSVADPGSERYSRGQPTPLARLKR